MTLAWGGRGGAANQRPVHPSDPGDPAYEWSTMDTAVKHANDAGINVLLRSWAPRRGRTVVSRRRGRRARPRPSASSRLRRAPVQRDVPRPGEREDPAAGGSLARLERTEQPGLSRPAVRPRAGKVAHGLAGRVRPHLQRRSTPACARPGGRSRSPAAPRRRGARSADRLPALDRAARVPGGGEEGGPAHVRRVGPSSVLRGSRPTPATRNVGPHAIELGNIGTLIAKLTRLYGPKPVWITEYGYQTKPPDDFFGVSWKQQAAYLRAAYEIARRNPRIDLFTWFLLRDSHLPRAGGPGSSPQAAEESRGSGLRAPRSGQRVTLSARERGKPLVVAESANAASLRERSAARPANG